VSIVRYARDRHDYLVMAFNFTPVPAPDTALACPSRASIPRSSTAIRRSTARDVGNGGGVWSEPLASHGFDQSVSLTVPRWRAST